MLFYPAAVSPDSHLWHWGHPPPRQQTASPWRRLNPGQQALLVLAHLRKGAPTPRLKPWCILRKLRCCVWKAGQLAKAIHVLQECGNGG